MQIPSNINLSNLIAAQSTAKAQRPLAPAASPAAEAKPAEMPSFEPLLIPKADLSQKPAGQSPFPGSGGARLGGQIDIKI